MALTTLDAGAVGDAPHDQPFGPGGGQCAAPTTAAMIDAQIGHGEPGQQGVGQAGAGQRGVTGLWTTSPT